MSEVTAEQQAQMAIKLADSVRDLIRKEMLAAFEDPNFVYHFETCANAYFVDRFAYKLKNSMEMQSTVKQHIINQMNKY